MCTFKISTWHQSEKETISSMARTFWPWTHRSKQPFPSDSELPPSELSLMHRLSVTCWIPVNRSNLGRREGPLDWRGSAEQPTFPGTAEHRWQGIWFASIVFRIWKYTVSRSITMYHDVSKSTTSDFGDAKPLIYFRTPVPTIPSACLKVHLQLWSRHWTSWWQRWKRLQHEWTRRDTRHCSWW